VDKVAPFQWHFNSRRRNRRGLYVENTKGRLQNICTGYWW